MGATSTTLVPASKHPSKQWIAEVLSPEPATRSHEGGRHLLSPDLGCCTVMVWLHVQTSRAQLELGQSSWRGNSNMEPFFLIFFFRAAKVWPFHRVKQAPQQRLPYEHVQSSPMHVHSHLTTLCYQLYSWNMKIPYENCYCTSESYKHRVISVSLKYMETSFMAAVTLTSTSVSRTSSHAHALSPR